MTNPGPGGYRPPANPAPVSGPAQLSQRTDGGPGQGVRDLPDARYGENKAFTEQQQGAPLAKAPDLPAPGSMPMPRPEPELGEMPARSPLVGFNEPSQRPGEDIMTGSRIGPGAGPRPGAGPQPGSLTRAMSQYVAQDDTGTMTALMHQLSEMGL